ncbi:MAG: hypothetical protein KAU50_06720 [Candidatus Marinimicrobia bacterium]|nr:hypothetical protein [Candidatus Neomarinimicrobiota bacterium]
MADILRDQGYPARLQLLGLLHDAHEAYLGDIVTPVAELLGRERLAELKRGLDGAIYLALGVARVNDYERDLVKMADEIALVTEVAPAWRAR